MVDREEWAAGFAAGSNEVVADRWSVACALDFLKLTERASKDPLDPENDYLAGFREAVKRHAAGADFPKDGKSCACGVKHDARAWALLPLGGERDYEGERLEFRNCECASTLTVVVARSAELRP